jgi:hypothetical protein
MLIFTCSKCFVFRLVASGVKVNLYFDRFKFTLLQLDHECQAAHGVCKVRQAGFWVAVFSEPMGVDVAQCGCDIAVFGIV